MNVLIISANMLPMSPVGAAYIAGAALDAGHRVAVFDCLKDQGNEHRFHTCLGQFEPDEMDDFVDSLAEHKNYLVQINTTRA